MFLSGRAQAHSVHVDPFVAAPGSVTIEAYFGDGKPIAGAMVRVRDQAGQELLSGTTDAQGRYLYKPTATEPVMVEVLQAGHRGTAAIDQNLLAEALAGREPVQTPPPAPGAAASPSREPAVTPPAPGRARATEASNLVPALAGVALILAAAALWQVRTLSRRVDSLGRQIESRHK